MNLVILKSKFNAEIINVASGKELYIKDVVSVFYSLINGEVNFNFLGQKREGDPSNWKADISKIEGYGFKSEFSIEEGLKEYVKWLNVNA